MGKNGKMADRVDKKTCSQGILVVNAGEGLAGTGPALPEADSVGEFHPGLVV